MGIRWTIGRREVVSGIGAAIVGAPFLARAQQGKIPKIGVLVPADPDTVRIPFEEGLSARGYIVGRTILIEFRSADGRPDRLAALAAELVRLKVDILVAFQTPAAHAAKEATRDIPIVISAGDPIGTGLVASLAQPGGNITGISATTAELGEKTLELMREVMPTLRRVGMLANAVDPFTRPYLRQFESGAAALGITLKTVSVRVAEEFARAFAELNGWSAQAVIVQPSLPRKPALDLVRQYRLPAVSSSRDFAVEGGLLSFAADQRRTRLETATYVDKILKGAKPGDLPVQQPTMFELVVNLKVANALGLKIPPLLLARADEVIE